MKEGRGDERVGTVHVMVMSNPLDFGIVDCNISSYFVWCFTSLLVVEFVV